MDLPHVAARAPATLAALRAVMPHGRLMGISSANGTNLRNLLGRTRQTLDSMAARKAASMDARKAAELKPTGPTQRAAVVE